MAQSVALTPVCPGLYRQCFFSWQNHEILARSPPPPFPTESELQPLSVSLCPGQSRHILQPLLGAGLFLSPGVVVMCIGLCTPPLPQTFLQFAPPPHPIVGTWRGSQGGSGHLGAKLWCPCQGPRGAGCECRWTLTCKSRWALERGAAVAVEGPAAPSSGRGGGGPRGRGAEGCCWRDTESRRRGEMQLGLLSWSDFMIKE